MTKHYGTYNSIEQRWMRIETLCDIHETEIPSHYDMYCNVVDDDSDSYSFTWKTLRKSWRASMTLVIKDVTCKECRKRYFYRRQLAKRKLEREVATLERLKKELADDTFEFDVWISPERVLEGRQGAARGAEQSRRKAA